MDTENIKQNITKILKNKNTFTILIVFVGIIALYMVYNWRINEATSLMPIPYAKNELTSRSLITENDVSTMQVPKSLISNVGNIIPSSRLVVGKFVNYGYTIPENSLFYEESILETAQQPESPFKDLPNGFTIFNLKVDFNLTYGNSIYPGNYIDLYIKAKDGDKILFGRLIKGIKVTAIYDGDSKDVFESSSESRNPRYMFFSVPDELYSLLMKANYIGAQILPIPRNASYSQEERSPEIDSTYIQNFILAKSVNFNN